MIDQSKTYRTKSGHEVRIYATDGKHERPVHGAVNEDGWILMSWYRDGHLNDSGHHSESDLVEADPHGILPRHRELLAEEVGKAYGSLEDGKSIFDLQIEELPRCWQVALIALARLEKEKGE